MSQIQLSHLTFQHDGSEALLFDDVSLQLDTGWRLGLIGRNGRGKTTLLKLLMGEYEYRGTISASVDFAYFPYTAGQPQESALRVAENAAQGRAEEWEIQRELSLLALPQEVWDRPFFTLSPGEQTKVLLAALFPGENRFLLIDEPTNHLDQEARREVAAFLNRKKGFILVSHDRAFLDGCIDHVLSINRSDIELQRGNFSSWKENRDRQDQFEQARDEKLRGDICRLSEAARRAGAWSDQTERSKFGIRHAGLRPDRGYIGHQSAKMMKRAKSIEARREKAVEEKRSLLQNRENAETLFLRPLACRSRLLAEAKNLTLLYPPRTVCGPLHFTVEAGDRIALIGRNGSGKTTLLRLLAGEPIAYEGLLRMSGGLVLSTVSQEISVLSGGLETYAAEHRLEESLFFAVLRKLGFRRELFDCDMGHFSAGQKKKVLLARSLCEPAHLYLWDEPLNYVDVLSRIQMEELLCSSGATLLFVEHDAAFVRRVATKTVHLDPPSH
ncbi:MAG: ABC-F type ribosomal protection protein [Clostridiales bacterium]|nr:ABC-F type ribosomal protection protein [Clostridiales bacterium]